MNRIVFLRSAWACLLGFCACGGRLSSPGNPDSADASSGPPRQSDASESDSGASDSPATSEPPPDSGISLLPFQVLYASYSRGLDRLVVVAADNTMHLVDPHTLDDVSLMLPPGGPKSLAISPDGLVAAVASEPQHYVTTFDLQARKPIAQYAVSAAVAQVVLAASNAYVFTQTAPGFRTIDLTSHAVTPYPPGGYYDDDTAFLSLSPDGADLVIATDLELFSFDVGHGQPQLLMSAVETTACDWPNAWFSRDGSIVFTECGEVRRVADLSLVQMLPQDASLIVSLDPYSADGTFAAIASLDQGRQGPEVCIFDSSFNLASTQPIPSWQTGGPEDSTAANLIFHDASGTGLFVLLDNSDSGGIDTWAISRL